MSAERPPVSVVVPFAGPPTRLREALASLGGLDLTGEDELLVADNSGDLMDAEEFLPRGARLVSASREPSSYHARNAGAARASRAWILFLDADVIPRPNLLEAYFARAIDSGTGVVAGEIVGITDQTSILAAWARWRRILSQAEHSLSHQFRPFGSTANLLVRRSALSEAGGFAESIRSGGDADLCWRLADLGWGIEYRSEAVVEHRHRERPGPLLEQATRYGRGFAWLRRRWGLPRDRGRRLVEAGRSLLAIVKHLLLGRPRLAAFRGIDLVFLLAESWGRLLSNDPPMRRPGLSPAVKTPLPDTHYVGSQGARGTSGMRTGKERRPRLLVLTPDYPPAIGGIQHLAARLTEHMEGFERRVVTFGEPLAAGTYSHSPPVRRVAASRVPGGSNLTLNRAALIEARDFDPDVVLSVHIVCSPAAAALTAWSRIPFVQYLHADEVAERPHLARFALRTAAAAIAVSAYTEGLARELRPRSRRIVRIPPGVDLPAGERTARSPRPTVVTVARLDDRYKGHDVMLETVGLLRERIEGFRWVVVGEGRLGGELRRRAADLSLDGAVEFTGAVDDATRDRLLDEAWAFALPSRLPDRGAGGEGFGIVYSEAGAHGLPVVAGNVAGALDAVIDGETGILVDPTSPREVADALGRLLENTDEAERMGRAGAARAAEHAWPRIAGEIEALLMHVRRG